MHVTPSKEGIFPFKILYERSYEIPNRRHITVTEAEDTIHWQTTWQKSLTSHEHSVPEPDSDLKAGDLVLIRVFCRQKKKNVKKLVWPKVIGAMHCAADDSRRCQGNGTRCLGSQDSLTVRGCHLVVVNIAQSPGYKGGRNAYLEPGEGEEHCFLHLDTRRKMILYLNLHLEHWLGCRFPHTTVNNSYAKMMYGLTILVLSVLWLFPVIYTKFLVSVC